VRSLCVGSPGGTGGDLSQLLYDPELLFAVEDSRRCEDLNADVVAAPGRGRDRPARKVVDERRGVVGEQRDLGAASQRITARARSCASRFLSLNVPAAAYTSIMGMGRTFEGEPGMGKTRLPPRRAGSRGGSRCGSGRLRPSLARASSSLHH
jgi:hypothetical protein